MQKIKQIRRFSLEKVNQKPSEQLWVSYVAIPRDAEILCVTETMNETFLIVLCQPSAFDKEVPWVSWAFASLNENRNIPPAFEYVGSVFLYNGSTPQHIFHNKLLTTAIKGPNHDAL